MVLKHTTLTIDHDMIEQAKEKNINISEFLRNALKEYLEQKTAEEFENLLHDLKLRQIEVSDVINEVENRIKEVKEEKDRKDKEILELYAGLPECQNLTSEQLVDKDFMVKLVDILREKYPEKKASVTSIREYYKLLA